ncbi:hypothetical protein ACTVZP_22200, partial [Rhodobacter sp. NSM]
MPLTLPAAPNAPTLTNPATFEVDTSAFLAWMASLGTAMTGKALLVSDILGTVAQSAGLPTGALIERGSNANGEYTRFADGTQICFINAFDLPYLPGAGGAVCQGDWTFPATFAAQPAVMAMLNGPNTQGTVAPSLEMLGAVMWANSGMPTASARLTLRRNAGQTNFVAGNA